MKQRIFMYLFLFSVLLVIFQYVNSKGIIDKYEKDIKVYKAKIAEQDTLINTLRNQNFDLALFQIDGNEEALSYFEQQGFDVDKLIPMIEDGLYNTNDYEGEDHPMVPFVSLTYSKLIINTIRILNHKWIIANFSDGEYWGEIFLTYAIDEDQNLTYDLKEYFLYPKAIY